MNKKIIISILISTFSFLFVHSELIIADCEEHLHDSHDFCVLVQDTLPVKQKVNIALDLFNFVVANTTKTIDISSLSPQYYILQQNNTIVLNETPLHIKHQSFLI